MKLTMVGRLDECLLLAYRTPAESVRHLVPAGLELLTRGPFAFWNVVACHVDRMRPTGLPSAVGVSYYHVACRLYVHCRTATGETLDGLYFVRSDADSGLVCCFGNWFTDFHFHRNGIGLEAAKDGIALHVQGGDDAAGQAKLRAKLSSESAVADRPDAESPFACRAEAAAFLKYRPLGLSPNHDRTRARLAEVFRDESSWQETPIAVTEARWSFLDGLGQSDLVLEHATRVAPIDYRWRLGTSRALPRALRIAAAAL